MRIEGDFIKINDWLLPFSWLYGLAVRFRNQLFEIGILKSKTYKIPIISWKYNSGWRRQNTSR